MGSQKNGIQNTISQKSGLSSGIVSNILELVAPMIMGELGKMFARKSIDQQGLSSLLGE